VRSWHVLPSPLVCSPDRDSSLFLLPVSVQVRILEVLVSVAERDERAAMLPDAFTPPGSTAGKAGCCTATARLCESAVWSLISDMLQHAMAWRGMLGWCVLCCHVLCSCHAQPAA